MSVTTELKDNNDQDTLDIDIVVKDLSKILGPYDADGRNGKISKQFVNSHK